MVFPDQVNARRSRTSPHETATHCTSTAQAALLPLVDDMDCVPVGVATTGAWRTRAFAIVALALVFGLGGAAYANSGPFVAGVFIPAEAALGGVLAPRSMPEPVSLALFGAALSGSAAFLRRRRSNKSQA